MMEGENLTREQIEEEIKKIKEAHAEDKEFLDEVDTPIDIPARKRFAKYRGLKSFKTSSWDPKESLPLEHARIFAFDNFTRTQKHVLARAFKMEQENMDYYVAASSYVRLHIKEVPIGVAYRLCELQNLKIQLQKLQLQNWNLAQSNSQFLAELNLGRAKLKSLQHELVCKDALIKVKNMEQEEREEVTEQCLPNAYDNEKTTGRGRRRATSKSMGPSTTNRQATEKEKVENKRRCMRRQSARFQTYLYSCEIFQVRWGIQVFAVIGSGVAGLRYALEVAKIGYVAVITKAEPHESNTNYAQGSVSAVLCPSDSVESRMQDTIVAGTYLHDEETVRVISRPWTWSSLKVLTNKLLRLQNP